MSLLEPISAKREDSIDLIRALAVISVLLFHYTYYFKDEYVRWHYTGFRFTYGYLGVQLFFILSGYCIYLTIAHSRSLADFFAKRLSRLWPALIAAATVTFLAIEIFGLPGRGVSILKYISNLLFLNVFTNRYVDTVYWTLTIELKFYFWFGILYFLNAKNIARTWAYFSLAAMAISGLSFSLTHYTALSQAFKFLAEQVFIYPYAVWFLAGIVIYEWNSLSWRQRILLLAPVGAALTISAIWVDWVEALILIPCVIGCIIVIPLRGLTIPWSVRLIGLISYPLYLVHQFIGIIVIRELPALNPYLRIGIASAIVILIAAIIHYALEWRFRPLFRQVIDRFFTWAFSRAAKRIPTFGRFLKSPLS
jgi:peptidoglycan/LPS O-acetylase OafA/YrhL